VKDAVRVKLAAFVTGPVRVVTAVVTGFLPCKLLMGNVVTDVTGLHPQGGRPESGPAFARSYGASRKRMAEADRPSQPTRRETMVWYVL
jgi:hypothetical protein